MTSKKKNQLQNPKKATGDELLEAMHLLQTTKGGFIETEGMERSFQISQDKLVQHVAAQNVKKRFDLDLPDPNGGYSVDYTRSGRFLLMGGSGGHLAAFDWMAGRLRAEIEVNETVRDVAWLQDETFFAAAQKSSVFIYDQSGTEVHCLRKHTNPTHLEFLPYHYLLFSACGDNFVRYQDVSTGQQVAEWNTKSGVATACSQNPSNAVTFTGHAGGTVSLWSPTVSNSLVKMFVHKGPVKAISIDSTGHYMATTGSDGLLKTWDLRTFKMLDQHKPAGRSITSMSISQTGLLATAAGGHVTVWKDIFTSHQSTPYLRHLVQSHSVKQVSFCPFEDILGIGHTGGFSSILIPGAGEANFDAFEANPYATKKQRQESQVKSLLDKLQPETIVLDPEVIGSVSRNSVDVVFGLQERTADANNLPRPSKEKNKARGKSSSKRRMFRKRANIIDEAKQRAAEEARKLQVVRSDDSKAEKSWSALDRFTSKDA